MRVVDMESDSRKVTWDQRGRCPKGTNEEWWYRHHPWFANANRSSYRATLSALRWREGTLMTEARRGTPPDPVAAPYWYPESALSRDSAILLTSLKGLV